MSSFFRQITHYRGTEGPDQSENRLTEIFASVLQRVPALAETLASQWLMSPVSGRPVVQTQRMVRTQRGAFGFVDAELAVERDQQPPAVIWIENKLGAPESGFQLDTYVEGLSELQDCGDRQVVLLGPTNTMPEIRPSLGGKVRTHTWQEIARDVSELARDEGIGEVERWLLDQLHHYLREMKLIDTEPLRAEQALALRVLPEIRPTMDRLANLVDERLKKEWGPLQGSEARGGIMGPGWRCYAPTKEGKAAEPGWGPAFFEWTCRVDTNYVAEPLGGWVFAAGATFPKSGAPLEGDANRAWISARMHDEFRCLKDGGWWRVWRFRYPDQLLSESTLDAQAEKLSGWVLDAFEHLAENPPPGETK